MNDYSDLERLLATIEGNQAPGSMLEGGNLFKQQRHNMLSQFGATPKGGDVGSLIGNAAVGIDPRDPNRYATMPDGSLVGTRIAWSPDGKMPDLNAIAGKPGSMKLPQMGVPGGIPQNAIPRAKPNQFGMTRVSPGMYKDKDGKMIRSTTGAPARTRGTAKTNAKG